MGPTEAGPGGEGDTPDAGLPVDPVADAGAPDAGEPDELPEPEITYSVAFVIADVSDDSYSPVTEVRAELQAFQEIYRTASYGLVEMRGLQGDEPDLFGPITLDLPQIDGEDCPARQAHDEAAEALASQVDLSTYDFVVLGINWDGCVMPHGLAISRRETLVRTNIIDANGYRYLSAGTIAHEIGHNLGLPHAEGLLCTDGASRSTLDGTCEVVTYQDPSGLMGGGAVHIQTLFKEALGWLLSSNVSVAGPGDYTVRPLEERTQDLQLLKIPRGADEFLAIDYRHPGPDEIRATGEPVPGGVYLRVVDREPPPPGGLYVTPATRLLDMHPQNGEEDWEFNEDAALLPGESFRDPIADVTVINMSEDADGARIRVTSP